MGLELHERRNICRLVAGILVSDEDFAESERSFLARIYARFGLPEEESATIDPVDVGSAAGVLRELPDEVQAKVLALLIEAAIADGVVDGREHAYLLVAGAALGIEADVVEKRVAKRLQAATGPLSNPGLV